MAPVITNVAPTTELQAVNRMLWSIGEQPLESGTDLATAQQADIQMAVEVLRDTTREVLEMGWQFNTEIGFGIAPTTTYNWVDVDGVTTSLNIFVPPSGLAAFSVQKIPEQLGANAVDLVIRAPRKVSGGGITRVFYDRARSRDGLPADRHPHLYINPVWYQDFESLPGAARTYITARASRNFAEGAVGSSQLSRFTEDDVLLALRTLKRDYGMEDEYLLIPAYDLNRARGGRFTGYSGGVDFRRNRNSV